MADKCGGKVVPHGVAYEQFKEASENQQPVMQISTGAIALMFESSRPFTITDYAWNSSKLHEHDPTMWDNLIGTCWYYVDFELGVYALARL